MSIVVRKAQACDFEAWLVLWNSYSSISSGSVSEDITQHTWKRTLDPASPVLCRLAEFDGNVVGFAMCVLHEGTYYNKPVCYLEDFFVMDGLRGKGIGKAVLEHLRNEAISEGWAKVYWFTRSGNPARKLYDKVAATDDVVRYRMTL